MDLRKTFNTDEYNYDRSRPDFYVNSFSEILELL